MSSNMPWFRFYTEALDDRKLAHVIRQSKQPKVIIIGLWTTILAIANNSPSRGTLQLTNDIPITLLDLSIETGLDIELVSNLVSLLVEVGVLEVLDGDIYSVTNWGKRQFTSDHSTERVRKHREEKKGNDNETKVERFRNVSETDQIQITDTESEPDADSDTESDILPVPEKIREIQTLTVDAIKRKKLKASEWQQLLEYEQAVRDPPRKGLIKFIEQHLANGHLSPGQVQYLALFGAKRFSNPTQARTVQEAIAAHGLPLIIEVATWATNKGFRLGNAVAGLKKTAANWNSKQKRGDNYGAYQRDSRARTGETQAPLPSKYDRAEVERNRQLLEEHRARMYTVQGTGGEPT